MPIAKKYNPSFPGKATQASSRAARMREQADGAEMLVRELDNQITKSFSQKDSNDAALERLQNEALGRQ